MIVNGIQFFFFLFHLRSLYEIIVHCRVWEWTRNALLLHALLLWFQFTILFSVFLYFGGFCCFSSIFFLYSPLSQSFFLFNLKVSFLSFSDFRSLSLSLSLSPSLSFCEWFQSDADAFPSLKSQILGIPDFYSLFDSLKPKKNEMRRREKREREWKKKGEKGENWEREGKGRGWRNARPLCVCVCFAPRELREKRKWELKYCSVGSIERKKRKRKGREKEENDAQHSRW